MLNLHLKDSLKALWLQPWVSSEGQFRSGVVHIRFAIRLVYIYVLSPTQVSLAE